MVADFLRTDAHPRDRIYGGIDTVKSYLKHVGKPEVLREEGEGYGTNNCSLFEISDLEKQTICVNSLHDNLSVALYAQSVIKKE